MKEEPVIELLKYEQAITKFALDKYDPLQRLSVSVVIHINGDIHIKENLDSWHNKVLKGNPNFDGTLLIIVDGKLEVDGIVTGTKDFNTHLLVLGDLHCEILRSCDEVTHITGNAFIKYVYDGNYNDGCIVIEGKTDVPYFLNQDHSSSINLTEESVLICYMGDDGFFNYDLTQDDFKDTLLPEIYSYELYEDEYDEDEVEEEGEFDREAFYRIVKSGRSPFKDGFELSKKDNTKLVSAIVAEEIAEITAKIPIPIYDLAELMDHLEKVFVNEDCDHTLKITTSFLESRQLNKSIIVPWLGKHGGYCDCEVLANVEDSWESDIVKST